jgi:two-component system sensor histidine kinase RegB
VEQTNSINFAWLLKLRWGGIIGQVVLVVLIHWGLGIALPLLPLFLIIALGLASNVACAVWMRRNPEVPHGLLGGVMLTDVVLLTGLLYFTGGPFNPFSFLYLVNIALAAVVLQSGWTWALVSMSLGCYGALFVDHVPLPLGQSDGHGTHMWMHLQGMWIAFGVTAAFIAYFIQRITRALAQRDADLVVARSLSARQERLASLATLAAGATHELSTPLSTIAVVAKELEHQLEHGAGGAAAVEDARLIRREVDRCRDILTQLATDAGESTGEAFHAIAVEELFRLASRDLPGGSVHLAEDPTLSRQTLYVPPRAVAQALRAVLKNARQASPRGEEITVSVGIEHGMWRFVVRDRGAGMSEQMLGRAAEPFFTTKDGREGQRGMGLGLFLARAVLERIGGRLDLESQLGVGTTATLIVPADASAVVGHASAAGGKPSAPAHASMVGG